MNRSPERGELVRELRVAALEISPRQENYVAAWKYVQATGKPLPLGIEGEDAGVQVARSVVKPLIQGWTCGCRARVAALMRIRHS